MVASTLESSRPSLPTQIRIEDVCQFASTGSKDRVRYPAPQVLSERTVMPSASSKMASVITREFPWPSRIRFGTMTSVAGRRGPVTPRTEPGLVPQGAGQRPDAVLARDTPKTARWEPGRREPVISSEPSYGHRGANPRRPPSGGRTRFQLLARFPSSQPQ